MGSQDLGNLKKELSVMIDNYARKGNERLQGQILQRIIYLENKTDIRAEKARFNEVEKKISKILKK